MSNVYSRKVDIWAIGCILHETVFRQKAFSQDLSVFEYRSWKDNFLELMANQDDNPFELRPIVGILSVTLDRDAVNRPSAQSLLKVFQHAFTKATTNKERQGLKYGAILGEFPTLHISELMSGPLPCSNDAAVTNPSSNELDKIPDLEIVTVSDTALSVSGPESTAPMDQTSPRPHALLLEFLESHFPELMKAYKRRPTIKEMRQSALITGDDINIWYHEKIGHVGGSGCVYRVSIGKFCTD